MEFKQKLIELGACKNAIKWVGDRTLEQAWQDCHRGDWMAWLIQRANMCGLCTLTLIKARCAELAKPFTKDQRSINALQTAFDFANGVVGVYELCKASDYALMAVRDNYNIADYAILYACSADSSALDCAFAAACCKGQNDTLRKCADICREVIPNPSLNI